ncbi:MAG: tetratricopeptide repeat protein [Ktedonobacteraceae bacterium]|nr:tetratricopeptide repeat protein [Ktedonobacteraceae bacterium]
MSSKQTQLNEALPWWYVYGPFPPGEGNMPHTGRVIAAYRGLAGWDVARLAAELGISERRIYQIEGSPALPEPFSRRELLVHSLKIPPALLGMLVLNYTPARGLALTSLGETQVLPSSTVDAYEGVLSLAWEAYYTSSAQRSASTVALWQHHLHDSLGTVGGIAQDQIRALLCCFNQLSGVIARDRLDFDAALAYARESLLLADHLNNVELMASSLCRRGRTYTEMDRYDLAVADFERAMPYARRSRDSLRAYVFICLAEAYSMLNPLSLELQKKSMVLLDEVGRVVRAYRGRVLEGDGSYTHVDVPGLYMVRGDVLRRFGRLDDAQDALLIVRDNLPHNFTRWQGNLLVADAQLCHAEGDYSGTCELAQDALSLVDETHSSSTRAKIERLYRSLVQQAPCNAGVRTLGKRLGLLTPSGRG